MQCHSLIEELQASHSTDLQQRAYELQALLDLDSRAVEHVMPFDASCEDIEVSIKKCLSLYLMHFYLFIFIFEFLPYHAEKFSIFSFYS